jgi:nucleoside-diphosphate-sugar epimerase
VRRLLVTGASGFLGWNVCREAREAWKVHAVVYRNDLVMPGVTVHRCDLTDSHCLDRLIDTVGPNAVIHAAAVSQPNDCERNPDEARVVNVTTVVEMARVCEQRAIPLAFTSTDLVFDGLSAPMAGRLPRAFSGSYLISAGSVSQHDAVGTGRAVRPGAYEVDAGSYPRCRPVAMVPHH